MIKTVVFFSIAFDITVKSDDCSKITFNQCNNTAKKWKTVSVACQILEIEEDAFNVPTLLSEKK